MRSGRARLVLVALTGVLACSDDDGTGPDPDDGPSQCVLLTDLGTLGGTRSFASGINDAGRVVGESNVAGDTAAHAFLWQDGVMTDLGTLGSSFSTATAINESGWIVGYSRIPNDVDFTVHAVLWRDRMMTDLGTLGGSQSWARDINDAGWVVGTSLAADGTRRAFLWRDGVMSDLGTLGGLYSDAYGLNDAGDVVGVSTLPGDLTEHAFLWRGGTMMDLGAAGGVGSAASDVGEAGQVVGSLALAGGAGARYHAFRWENGVMTDLGTLMNDSHAAAINVSGWVVGQSTLEVPGSSIPRLTIHAVLWRGGSPLDLGALDGRERRPSAAYDINAAGLVAGMSETASGGIENAAVWDLSCLP